LQKTSRKPLLEAQRRSQEAQVYAEASLRNTQVMESMGMMPAVMEQWQKKTTSFFGLSGASLRVCRRFKCLDQTAAAVDGFGHAWTCSLDAA
jgi:ABC-type protease/lipase transport system fused ATPase/permease subunit